MKNCIQLQEKLEQKKKRLLAYYMREEQILSNQGVKSYSIGGKNLSRWDTTLKEIQDSIKLLEREISEIENVIAGKSQRKAVAVVIRDW